MQGSRKHILDNIAGGNQQNPNSTKILVQRSHSNMYLKEKKIEKGPKIKRHVNYFVMNGFV